MNKINLSLVFIFIINTLSFAQVGIGTSNPDSSAILHLDVSSLAANAKKGFLGPKVGLNSTTDTTIIPNPAIGLLIYNTGAGMLKTEGYLMWDGTEWVKFSTISAASPLVSTLNCGAAILSPSSFTASVAYTGVMTVQYTGGNGGSYAAGTAINATSGGPVTATLRAGILAIGNGELIYDIVGTPNASTIVFPIPTTLGAVSCSVSITSDNTEIKTLKYAINKFDYTDLNFISASTTTFEDITVHINENPFVSSTRQVYFSFSGAEQDVNAVSFKRGGGGNFFAARNQLFSSLTAGQTFTFADNAAQPHIVNNDVVNYEIYNPRKGKVYRVSVSLINTFRSNNTGTGKGFISIEILD